MVKKILNQYLILVIIYNSMEEGKIENIICKMYVLNKSMIEQILNIKVIIFI